MPPTVQRAVSRYLVERSRRGDFRPQTTATVRLVLHRFAEHVGSDRPLATLTRRDVRGWWGSLAVSSNTARTRLSFVRQWVHWCIDQEWLRADLTIGIKAPKVRRLLPVTLTTEQVQAVLRACPDERSRLMVLLMVQLGMRAGEVTNAQTGDVDMANRLMRISGKGGHERVEPIPDELFLALVVWLRRSPAGPLIGRQVGSSWRPLSRKYISLLTSRIMYAAGVKVSAGDMISAHALRRTAISDVLEGGAALNVVQAFAGHNQIASLSPYIRLRPAEELRQAVEGRTYLEPG